MPDVSVIMPVYNSEKYLGNAIESVLDQTYHDFELILIDDGSTDRSGAICDKYASEDVRVKVIHQKNQGICAARNQGLDIATGKYIAFIDNDDYYYPDYIKENIDLAMEYDADVIRFDRLRIQSFENSDKTLKDIAGTREIVDAAHPVKVMRGEEILANYDKIKKSGALYGIWNGMFKKIFLDENKLRFCSKIRYGGEDGLLNMQAVKLAQCYVFHKGVYYRYERRYGNSTSTKFNKNRLDTILLLLKEERKIVEKLEGSEGFWLYNQTDNAIGVMQILAQKNCDWSWKKKRSYLKYLLEKSEIRNDNYKKYIKEVYQRNMLIGIMCSLFYRRIFIPCFAAIKAYEVLDKVKNR